MNFGHISLTVDINSNTECPNTNCSYFYDFLDAVLWALITQGRKFHSKKNMTGPRVSVSSQYKKDNCCLPTQTQLPTNAIQVH
jgi:hypothetical protein